MGYSGDAEELADLLPGIHRLVRRRLRRQSDQPRMRGGEVELLRIVAAEPGIGVGAAARELHLAENTVSTLVNHLVKSGLLVRTPDPADRRAARLEPTEAGAELLADWRRRRGDLFAEMLEKLAETDRKALREAIPALRRLADNLSTEVEG